MRQRCERVMARRYFKPGNFSLGVNVHPAYTPLPQSTVIMNWLHNGAWKQQKGEIFQWGVVQKQTNKQLRDNLISRYFHEVTNISSGLADWHILDSADQKILFLLHNVLSSKLFFMAIPNQKWLLQTLVLGNKTFPLALFSSFFFVHVQPVSLAFFFTLYTSIIYKLNHYKIFKYIFSYILKRFYYAWYTPLNCSQFLLRINKGSLLPLPNPIQTNKAHGARTDLPLF